MKKLRSSLLPKANAAQTEGDISLWTGKGNFMKKNRLKVLIVLAALFANLTFLTSSFGAIALRGTATSATTVNTSLIIGKPTGVVAGDVMIVNINQVGNTTTDPTSSGWTLIDGATASGSLRYGAVLYKVADGTEGTGFTFTLGPGVTNAVGSIIAFSGVSGLTFDVTPGTINAAVPTVKNRSYYANANSITTVTNNAAVIFLAQSKSTGTTNQYSNWSGSTPTFIEAMDVAASNTGPSVGAAWGLLGTALSTENKTVQLTGNFYCGGILIALRPVSGVTPPAITSLGSISGCMGGSITINGTNLTGATAASVKIGGTPVSSITTQTATQIVAVIGNGSTGKVTVGTPGGTALSGSAFTVNALPATPTITAGGPTAFCVGGSVALTSSPGTTYLWSTGATSSSINITTSGSYSVQVTNAAGCQSSASIATVVTVNAFPSAVTVTPSNATICNGTIQLLTATNYVNSSPQIASSGTISILIPDNNAAGSTSTLPVSGIPADATITDISVNFNTTMIYDGDLIFNLKAPNNNILNLVNRAGGSGDNFTNTVISSSSSNLLSSGSAPFTGSYAADAASSVGPTAYISNVTSFSGLTSTPNGNWVFAVSDAAAQDIGTITSWSITITYTRPAVTWSPATGLYTDAGAITSYSGGPATTVYAKPTSSQTYTATVISGNGCSNSGNVAIAVTPTVGTPSVPTPSASTICQGSANTIYTTSATNATSFTWSVTGTGNTISGTGTTGTVTWAPGFSGLATVSVIANGCGTSSPSSTTVTVTASVTPGVTISASANPVSSGTSVTFTPTPVNGGTPTYNWWVNGLLVGTNNTYSYTPNELDQVYVILTSTLSCVTAPVATSNTIIMTVNPLITSVSWTGLASSDWNTQGNWAPAMVPGPGISVTITNVANKPVISTADNECKNLTLGTGAILTIAYNGNLTVNGALTNTGAPTDLVIQSTSSGSGSLITKGTVIGTATVGRYIGGASWGWHFLGSPVTAQAISPDFVASSTSTTEDFYTWYEPQLTWVNFKNTTNAPTWNTTNGSTNFVPGRGYLVAYEATNATKLFKGSLNTGTVSYSLTHGGSATYQYYNLVANPYPCSIDWDATSGWGRSNLDGTQKSYWIWNDAIGNYGAYITGSFGFGTNGVTNYISCGQGFMVLAQSVGNLTMDDGIKAHNSQAYLKREQLIGESLRLKLNCDVNTYSDEAIIAFNSTTSEGGSHKFNSMYTNAPEIWSVKNGGKYSINFMEDISSAETVPLSVKAGVAGTYTITASQVESFSGNSSISLEDRSTGTFTYLDTTPSYSFQVSAPSTIANRFFLHFKDVTAIPNSDVARNFNIYSADGMLNIQSLQQMGGKVAIIDMLGRTVTTGRVEAGSTLRIDMHGNTGVYIVSILTDKGISNTKILIK